MNDESCEITVDIPVNDLLIMEIGEVKEFITMIENYLSSDDKSEPPVITDDGYKLIATALHKMID